MNKPTQKKSKHFIINGIALGLIILLINEIIRPLIRGEELSVKWILILLPIWIAMGIGLSYLEKLVEGKAKRTDKSRYS